MIDTIPILDAIHLGDIVAKQGVELKVRQDGLVLWINVDGVCVTRIITNGFIPIEIMDGRKGK